MACYRAKQPRGRQVSAANGKIADVGTSTVEPANVPEAPGYAQFSGGGVSTEYTALEGMTVLSAATGEEKLITSLFGASLSRSHSLCPLLRLLLE